VYYDGINLLSHGGTTRIGKGRIKVSMPASFRYHTIPRMRATAANSDNGNADIPCFARACYEAGSVRKIPNLKSIPYIYTTNSPAEYCWL
jgi:hypothetical protein